VQLSPTEFKLLRYFMSNANRVLSKMQILDHVWDYDLPGRHRDRRVLRFRCCGRKIDNPGATADPHPCRGVGYVLRLPVVVGTAGRGDGRCPCAQ